MAKYLVKRVVLSLFTLLALVTVVFVLVHLLPGNPFSSDKLTPQILENLNKYYGLDKPLYQQYFTYLGNLLQGNLGYSLKYVNQSVNDIIFTAFPNSADLGIRALTFALSFGLVFGTIAALNRGKKIDFICIVIAIVGTSVPDFIMGALLQYFFGVRWGLLPVAQYTSVAHTILPSIALGFYTLASVSRLMRSSMLEVLGQDYISTARVKGLTRRQIVLHHCMRNAIMPVVTVLGPMIAVLLTGAFAVESIFSIPGLGKYFVESVQASDYPVIVGTTLFFGSFLVLCNLAVDIAHSLVDPRIKLGGDEDE